jgi:hypothetical protein
MKTLETTFKQKGWTHTQVQRQGNIAIFERQKEGVKPHYEVVRIKSHNGFQIPGTDQRSEPAEYYPSENAWGVDGFTIHDLDEATAKMNTMLEAATLK